MSDSVNHPPHYNQGEVETIDGIRAALGESFVDYCRGNVLKYVWRCGKKGDAVEDLRKAAKCLEWAIEAMEAEKKPETLAIPEGWRELEENEPLCENDLFEFGGEWVGHEYNPAGGVYSSRIHRRHIRKIERSEPDGLAIPEGWRELEPDEIPLASDMYEYAETWMKRFDDGNCEYEWYDARHIRKIETEKTSEAPAEWIPKVGDKVRVVGNHPRLCGQICVVSEVYEPPLVSVVSDHDGDIGWMRLNDLELSEAAQ